MSSYEIDRLSDIIHLQGAHVRNMTELMKSQRATLRAQDTVINSERELVQDLIRLRNIERECYDIQIGLLAKAVWVILYSCLAIFSLRYLRDDDAPFIPGLYFIQVKTGFWNWWKVYFTSLATWLAFVFYMKSETGDRFKENIMRPYGYRALQEPRMNDGFSAWKTMSCGIVLIAQAYRLSWLGFSSYDLWRSFAWDVGLLPFATVFVMPFIGIGVEIYEAMGK